MENNNNFNYYSPYYRNMMVQPQMPQNYLKGRPVLSYDEARAAQIDLDGTVHIFTDFANNKIYTKQFNIDGTATLKTYALTENAPEPTAPNTQDYVTKQELEKTITELKQLFTTSNF